jgi:transposase
MTEKEIALKDVLVLLLPKEIFEYFEITLIDSREKEIHIYLDEINQTPERYRKERLISKGFYKTSIVQDFPIRDKATYLHVRRRRWLVESTGEVVSRDWNTVAKGTHLTKGFATFLKGIFG